MASSSDESHGSESDEHIGANRMKKVVQEFHKPSRRVQAILVAHGYGPDIDAAPGEHDTADSDGDSEEEANSEEGEEEGEESEQEDEEDEESEESE